MKTCIIPRTDVHVALNPDPAADPPYQGISAFIVEKGPGFNVTRDIDKLGYKGWWSMDQYPYRENGRAALAESVAWLRGFQAKVDASRERIDALAPEPEEEEEGPAS